MSDNRIPVMFRVESDGTCLAVFPTIQATPDGMIQCFTLRESHSHGDFNTMITMTRPAEPAQYERTLRALESKPYEYKLKVVKRRPYRS